MMMNSRCNLLKRIAAEAGAMFLTSCFGGAQEDSHLVNPLAGATFYCDVDFVSAVNGAASL